jgi:hypothetical protein
LKRPEVPAPGGGASGNEIDRFLRARQEAAGIEPAPRADKRTLLRRAAFDLTGLPPSAEEMAAFLADDSPEAFAKVIDRLLASPHYGEKWGRHWLDVARYGDSNGMDVDHAMANAWRYRDYVVAAFNADLPVDQFIREHIAGDLISRPAALPVPEPLVATGFLAIGPKVLAELDTEKKRMDIIDEQVDTIGRAFMGLTLGCARCHDHKFDPLPTADYYSLAGILRSTRTMEHWKRVSTWLERPLGDPGESEKHRQMSKQIAEQQEELDRFVSKMNEAVRAQARSKAAEYLLAATRRAARERAAAKKTAPAGEDARQRVMVIEAEDFVGGNVRIDRTELGRGIGVIRTTDNYPDQVEYRFEAPVAGEYQLELRYAAKEARPVQLVINGDLVTPVVAGKVAGESAAAQATGGWLPDAQRWETAGVFKLRAGINTLQIRREGPLPLFDKLLFGPPSAEPHGPRLSPQNADAAPQAYDARGLAADFLRRWSDALAKQDAGSPLAEWKRRIAASDGEPTLDQARAFVLEATGTSGESGSARVDENPPFLIWLNDAKQGPFALPKHPEKLYDEKAFNGLKKLRERLSGLKDALPQLAMAMAAEEGEIADHAVLIRGNHQNPGEIAPRRMLRIISGEDAPAVGPEESGRRQLAEWLTDGRHPLASRVFVNRVWLWHFGEGLVRTPDNFGMLGDQPVLGELLDWLALRFQDDGWSLKKLHRLIMLSAAYQRASGPASPADPENRLHARFAPRRLNAEEIRDAMLAASGRLDRTLGGSVLETRNRTYAAGGNAPKHFRKLLHYDTTRRSIYVPVIRTNAYEMFDLFDFPAAGVITGQRPRTTVPSQALFLMNSSFVHEAARAAAAALPKDADPQTRVAAAYRAILAREPEAAEADRAAAFIHEGGGRDAAWTQLCHALLISNEFLYAP